MPEDIDIGPLLNRLESLHINPAHEAQKHVQLSTKDRGYKELVTRIIDQMAAPSGDIKAKNRRAKISPEQETAHIFLDGVIPLLSTSDIEPLSISFQLDGVNYFIPATYTHGEDETDIDSVPHLTITRPKIFFAKLARLKKLRDTANIPWTMQENAENFFSTIWLNATSYDFEHPEQYLDKIEGFLNNDSFSEFGTPVELGAVHVPSPTWNQLNVQRRFASWSYETPYTMDVRFSNNSQPEAILDIGTCPSVRYAVDAQNTCHIYAVQMPKLSYVTENSIKEEAAAIERSYATNSILFRDAYVRLQPALVAQGLNLPESILDEKNPKLFLHKLNIFFEEHGNLCRDREARIHFFRSSKSFYGETFEAHANDIIALYNILGNLPENASIDEDFSQKRQAPSLRSQFTAEVNKLVKEGADGYRTVPPLALTSLVTMMGLCHSEGIRDITIPVHLPLRFLNHLSKDKRIKDLDLDLAEEHDASRIEEATVNRFVDTIMRLAQQIHGVEITNLPDGEFLRIRLGDTLTSDNKFFNGILETVGKVQKNSKITSRL